MFTTARHGYQPPIKQEVSFPIMTLPLVRVAVVVLPASVHVNPTSRMTTRPQPFGSTSFAMLVEVDAVAIYPTPKADREKADPVAVTGIPWQGIAEYKISPGRKRYV
jgi:hypothetical protein